MLDFKNNNKDTVREYLQANDVQVLEVFYNTIEFPLRIKSKETHKTVTIGPFTDDTPISKIEEALTKAVPSNNEFLKIFKGDNILGSGSSCRDEDIYRHSELEFANIAIFVFI